MTTNDRKWPHIVNHRFSSWYSHRYGWWFWGQFLPKAVHFFNTHISGKYMLYYIYIYVLMPTNANKWQKVTSIWILPRAQQSILRTISTKSSTLLQDTYQEKRPDTNLYSCQNYIYICVCWCQVMSTNDRKWPPYESCLARSSWFWGQFLAKAVTFFNTHIRKRRHVIPCYTGVITKFIYMS
jgi:hypothetical protein